MRGCVQSLLLVALLILNGYLVWQMKLLRAEMQTIREELVTTEEDQLRLSLLAYARDAAEAIGKGEINRAIDDLTAMDSLLKDVKESAETRKREWEFQLDKTKEAVSRHGERAAEEVNRLIRMLGAGHTETNFGETR